MTERRCIAMGRGSKEHPHFNLYDIDTHDIDVRELCYFEQALVIKTFHGYHLITSPSEPIKDERLLKLADPKCPGNAVRFYPHDDLELIKPAMRLCIKAAKIYESIFNGKEVVIEYELCDEPLKFGIYIAEKDGIKQIAEQRHFGNNQARS